MNQVNENILDVPGITKRMKMLCSNCQWLESNFKQCMDICKGFNCTKYQLKEEIVQKRSNDSALNNPYGWIGSKAK